MSNLNSMMMTGFDDASSFLPPHQQMQMQQQQQQQSTNNATANHTTAHNYGIPMLPTGAYDGNLPDMTPTLANNNSSNVNNSSLYNSGTAALHQSSNGFPVSDPSSTSLNPRDLEQLRYTYRPSKKSQSEALLPPLVDNLLLPPNSTINQNTHFNWSRGIVMGEAALAANTSNASGTVPANSASAGQSTKYSDPYGNQAQGGSYAYSYDPNNPNAPPLVAAPGFLGPPLPYTAFRSGPASVASGSQMSGNNASATSGEEDSAQNILKRRKRERHPEKWKRNNYVRKVLKDKGACSCTRQCFDLVPAAERENIKKEFAQLSKNQQDAHLLSLISIEEKRTAAGASAGPSAPSTHATKSSAAAAAAAAHAAASSINELANVASAELKANAEGRDAIAAAAAAATAATGSKSAANNDDDEDEEEEAPSDEDDDDDGETQSKATLESRNSAGSKRSPKLFNSKYFVRVRDSSAVHHPHQMHQYPLAPHAQQAPPGFRLIRVCHYAFLSIHGIGKKRVNNLVSHAFSSKDHQAPRNDLRGRHNNRANRVSEDLVTLAEAHVKSFPRYGIIDGNNDIWSTRRQERKERRERSLKLSITNTIQEESKENCVNDSNAASNSSAANPSTPRTGAGASASPASASRSFTAPLSVGTLLNRPPPRYLSPHLSLVRMYRLFIAQYQPVLLEVEKHAPRLARIDRAKISAAVKAENAAAATNSVAGAPATTSAPTMTGDDVAAAAAAAAAAVNTALMPPPPARAPGSVRSQSGMNISLERSASTNSVASSEDASETPRVTGPTVVSAFSSLSSSQLAQVFSAMSCSHCNTAPGIIPILWRQHFSPGGAAGSRGSSVTRGSITTPNPNTPAGKGLKRRREEALGSPSSSSANGDATATTTPLKDEGSSMSIPASLQQGATTGADSADDASVSTKGGTAKRRAATSAANSLSNSSLLGLFCSSNCVSAFLEKIEAILPHAIPAKPYPSTVTTDASGVTAGGTTRIAVPFAHWKDLPHLSQAEKLLKPLVSRDKYERLFRSLNMRFGSGKTDSCPSCNDFALKIEAGEALCGISRFKVQEMWNAHLLRAKKCNDVFEHDKKMAMKSWLNYYTTSQSINNNGQNAYQTVSPSVFASGTVDTLEIGFQSNRPVPQYSSSSSLLSSTNATLDQSFKRNLWVYLFGVYSVVAQQTNTFLWDERTGKRKVNEIISCLWRQIQANSSNNLNVAPKIDPITPSNNNGGSTFSFTGVSGVNAAANPTVAPSPASTKRAPWLILFGEGLRNYWSICFLNELCRDDGGADNQQQQQQQQQQAAQQQQQQNQELIGLGLDPMHAISTPNANAPSSPSIPTSLFSYRRIDYKILEGGHTLLDSDKILSCIDRDGKAHPVFKPQDWMDAIRNIANRRSGAVGNINTAAGGAPNPPTAPTVNIANATTAIVPGAPWQPGAAPKNKITPHWMGREYIYDWKSYLRQTYDKALSTKTVQGENVDLSKIVWFNFGVGKDTSATSEMMNATQNSLPNLVYHPDEVWVRYTLNDNEPWKKVRLRKYGVDNELASNSVNNSVMDHPLLSGNNNDGLQSLRPLYGNLPLEQPLPISAKKIRDLFELRKFIPSQFHSFYPQPSTISSMDDPSAIEGEYETEYEEEVEEEDLFLAPTGPVDIPPTPLIPANASVSPQAVNGPVAAVTSAASMYKPAVATAIHPSQQVHHAAHLQQPSMNGMNPHYQMQQQPHPQQVMNGYNASYSARPSPNYMPMQTAPGYGHQPQQTVLMQPYQPHPQQNMGPGPITMAHQGMNMQNRGPAPPPTNVGAPNLNLQSLGQLAANFTNQMGMPPPPAPMQAQSVAPPQMSYPGAAGNNMAMQAAHLQQQQPQQQPQQQGMNMNLGGVGSVSVYVNGLGHMDLHTLQTLSRLNGGSLVNGLVNPSQNPGSNNASNNNGTGYQMPMAPQQQQHQQPQMMNNQYSNYGNTYQSQPSQQHMRNDAHPLPQTGYNSNYQQQQQPQQFNSMPQQQQQQQQQHPHQSGYPMQAGSDHDGSNMDVQQQPQQQLQFSGMQQSPMMQSNFNQSGNYQPDPYSNQQQQMSMNMNMAQQPQQRMNPGFPGGNQGYNTNSYLPPQQSSKMAPNLGPGGAGAVVGSNGTQQPNGPNANFHFSPQLQSDRSPPLTPPPMNFHEAIDGQHAFQ